MLVSALRRFWRDDRGAAVYALALGLLFAAIATIALALDIGRAYVEHTRMQGYVDSLSLAAAAELDGEPDAIERASAVIAASGLGRAAGFSAALELDGDGDPIPTADAFAIFAPIFLSAGPTLTGDPDQDAAALNNLATTDPAKATHVLIRAKPRPDNWSLTALLAAGDDDGAGDQDRQRGLFDLSASAIASSQSENDGDVELTFVIDNSASMLLGATVADMDTIRTLHRNGKVCAFACHKPGDDTYQRARDVGALTRIDVARDALERSVATVRANPPTGGASVFYDVSTFATSLKPVAAGRFDEMPDDFEAVQPEPLVFDEDDKVIFMNSDPRRVVFDVASKMAQKAQAYPDRRHILVFVTDAVMDYDEDRDIKTTDDRRIRMILEDECETLKTAGVEIAVIYTTYLPIDGFWAWDNIISKFAPDITPRMKSCATEGLFFEAAFKEEIDAAFREITDLRGFVDRITLTD